MHASALLVSSVRCMSNSQRDTKAWIKAVATYMNLSQSELAKRAGLAPSTVTRYINDTTNTLGITQRSLDLIAQFSGIPAHRMPGEQNRSGTLEQDAEPLGNEFLPEWVTAAVDRLISESSTRTAWRMKGWALEMLGVLPGDILIIDTSLRPKSGDIVVAEVTDWAIGQKETAFRLYQPPFIVTHSSKLGPQKPLTVDEETVQLRGVCIATLRTRQ